MTAFDAYLDARDGTALAAAWSAVSPTTIDLSPERPTGVGILGFYWSGFALARLARAWLGLPLDAFHWLTIDELYLASSNAPAPTFSAATKSSRSFLEHRFDERDCFEDWTVREMHAGSRAMQWVHVGWGRGPMTREGGEGGSGTVVRFVDRGAQIGISVVPYTSKIIVFGEVDLAPVRAALDLFDFNPNFRMPASAFAPDHVRALVAQLASEIDAHFDTSATWSGRIVHAEDEHYAETHYEQDGFVVEVQTRRGLGTVDIALRGLPADQQFVGGVRFTPEATYAYFNIRLPAELALRVTARLATIEGLQRD